MKIKELFFNKIVQSTMWYTFSNFATKGIAFLTLPIFVRLLDPADYGLASVYTAWVSIFMIFIGLNAKSSITRARFETKLEGKYDEFASSIAFLSLCLFLFFTILAVILKDYLGPLVGLPPLLLLLAVVQAFFANVKKLAIGKFVAEYKYKSRSIATIIGALVGTGLSIFLIIYVFKDQPYYGKILGPFISALVLGLVFLIQLLSKGKTFVNYKYWKYALIISAPLIIHELSLVINNQFDRIIIQRLVGEGATGIYSFTYNFSMIIAVMRTSFAGAMAPWIYEKLKEGSYDNIKLKAAYYRDAFAFIYISVLLLSPEFIGIVASPSYLEGIHLAPWIFMAYFFQFMYVEEIRVEIFYKKTMLVSLGTVLSAALNIGLNLLLIPQYGYPAAAVTTAISFFFLFIYHYVVTSRVIKHKLYGLNFHLKSMIYLALSTVIFIVFKDMFFVRFIALFVAGLYFARNLIALIRGK